MDKERSELAQYAVFALMILMRRGEGIGESGRGGSSLLRERKDLLLDALIIVEYVYNVSVYMNTTYKYSPPHTIGSAVTYVLIMPFNTDHAV